MKCSSAALAKSAPLDFPSEKSFLVIRKCKTKMEVQFRFSAAKKTENKIGFIFLYNWKSVAIKVHGFNKSSWKSTESGLFIVLLICYLN